LLRLWLLRFAGVSKTKEASKIGTLENPSALGANPDLPGFTQKNLDVHFGGGGYSDHSGDYPEFTKEQYAQRAQELVRSPVGGNVVGYLATKGNYKGSVIRYDTVTEDWVRSGKVGIRTMFKPSEKMVYFELIRGYET
jgi:hypothetical protein